MSSISIRNSDQEGDTVISFPISQDQLTIDDLRSAFPTITSLRYKDLGSDELHHILCRNGVLIEPDGGWKRTGRIFIAVSGTELKGNSRFGLFESYRRQIATNASRNRNVVATTSRQRQPIRPTESTTTSIRIGHGHFKAGTFSKISSTNLAGVGGYVVVGPIAKSGNTSKEILEAAFTKFCQQNRGFRRIYRCHSSFHLVYPDGCIVKNLPDQSSEFSLEGYKNFLDPNRRFDRLRLYLCEKGNYDTYNTELLTDSSSSSDELPRITSRRQPSSPPNDRDGLHRASQEPMNVSAESHLSSSCHHVSVSSSRECQSNGDEDTLPLVIEVVFHHGEEIYKETFPNNTKATELFTFIHDKVKRPVLLKSEKKYINPDDRLLELTSSGTFHVYSGTIDSEEEENPEADYSDLSIPASFEDEDLKVVEWILQKTITETLEISEPTSVMKSYRSNFIRGRRLDVLEDAEGIEGDTSSIFVSRGQVLVDGMAEVQYLENIRNPLEVTFLGESAQDFGGPRKEFLYAIVHNIKENFVVEKSNGHFVLSKDLEGIALHKYYYAGLLIGLSAIEGGPLAPFLDSLVTNGDGEETTQFIKGLSRTGIMQLMQRKESIRYLFRARQNPLTVRKMVSLFDLAALSVEGSNRRTQEEETWRRFILYLREVYAGRRTGITLGAILRFVTGADEEPALGFERKPSVHFTELAGSLPTASTCSMELYLPTNLLSTELQFEKFDLAFANTFFGLV